MFSDVSSVMFSAHNVKCIPSGVQSRRGQPYFRYPCQAVAANMPISQTPVNKPGKSRLLNQVSERIRRKSYALRTEQSYIHWIKRFILFHDKQHPAEMGKAEVERFLTALAVERNMAASTQKSGIAGDSVSLSRGTGIASALPCLGKRRLNPFALSLSKCCLYKSACWQRLRQAQPERAE